MTESTVTADVCPRCGANTLFASPIGLWCADCAVAEFGVGKPAPPASEPVADPCPQCKAPSKQVSENAWLCANRHRWVRSIHPVRDQSDPIESPSNDPIESPAHYCQGKIECIDAIESALTPEEFRGFCKGSVIQYLWREQHKGGAEDVGKAAWYCRRLVKVLGEGK